MFYNIGYTVESILKDRSVSDVKIVMEDNGPHLTVTFDGVMQLVVNPEWFCLQSANAPLEDARVAGMFQVAWEDLVEHPSFPDTACSVTTWK